MKIQIAYLFAPVSVKMSYSVTQVDATKLTLLGWLEHGTAFTLYDDDGESAHIDLDKGLTLVDVQVKDGQVAAKAEGLELDVSQVVLG